MPAARRYARDHVAPFWDERRRQGLSADFHVGAVDLATRRVEWHTVDHARSDGAGALLELTRAEGSEARRAPVRPQPFPTVRERFALLRHLFRPAPTAVAWARERTPTARAPQIQWRVLERDETAALTEVARSQGVSRNTSLLSAFNAVLGGALVVPGTSYLWSIPVDLRASVVMPRETANHVSFVSVRADARTSAPELHRRVRERLASGEHWAVWLALAALRHAGSRPIRRLARDVARTSHIGIFTNVGSWTGGADGRAWVVAPIVGPNWPVGVAALEWNGRLSLAMACDGSLGIDDRLASALFAGAVERLLVCAPTTGP